MALMRLTDRGSALITGMIAALSVGVVSAVIMQQSQVTERQTRLPRIKSAMAATESQIREAVYSGDLLVDCVSGDPGFGQPKCKKIDSQKLSSYSKSFPGAKCAADYTGVCGIQVTANYNSGTSTLTGQVSYHGSEVAVSEINFSSTITDEKWNSRDSSCPNDKPLLAGFSPEGDPLCKPLPSNCGPGQYVKRIDPMSLTAAAGIQCAEIPNSINCPAGQFINNIRWSGNSDFEVGCQPSFNPFAANAIGDATAYEYQVVDNFASTNWPTTTACLNPTWEVTTTEVYPSSCNFGGGHYLANLHGDPCVPGSPNRNSVGCNHAGDQSTEISYTAVCKCNGPSATTSTVTTVTTTTIPAPVLYYKCKADGFGDLYMTGGPYTTSAQCNAARVGCPSCSCVTSPTCYD